jgi:hypothetical protein
MRINDNGIDRDMTEEEQATHEEWQKKIKADAAAEAKAKADNQALKDATLAKLGLTADEVSALLS